MNGLVLRAAAANASPVTGPVVLHLENSAGEGVPLPLGLMGMATELEGKPVFYRRKEICRAVSEPHRGRRDPRTGEPVQVDIPTARLDLWAQTFKRRLAKGIKPFLYPRHLDLEAGEPADARHTQGYLIDVERDGDKLFGTLQLIGEEARQCAAANDVSVTIAGDALDPEMIHHLAFTPNPQVTEMGGYTALVASADGKPVRASVFVLSETNPAGAEPAPERSPPMFKPETLTKLRAKFQGTKAEKLTDEQIAEQAAAVALADPPPDKTAEATALSADVARLTKERDDAAAKVLALSANAPRTDPETVADYQERVAELREAAISAGAVSAAQATAIDKLVTEADGSPSVLALSAHGSGAERRRFGVKLWKTIGGLAKDQPIRTGNAVTRTGNNGAALALSGDGGGDVLAEMEKARVEAAAWQQRQQQKRGLSTASA